MAWPNNSKPGFATAPTRILVLNYEYGLICLLQKMSADLLYDMAPQGLAPLFREGSSSPVSFPDQLVHFGGTFFTAVLYSIAP